MDLSTEVDSIAAMGMNLSTAVDSFAVEGSLVQICRAGFGNSAARSAAPPLAGMPSRQAAAPARGFPPRGVRLPFAFQQAPPRSNRCGTISKVTPSQKFRSRAEQAARSAGGGCL